jgi:2-iminobutanoate/2-iminopropanoate deaminase
MPDKKVIIPKGGAQPLAPYSPGIRYRNLIFCSGQIGLDPVTNQLVKGEVAAQAEQALQNLDAILKAAGASFASVLKVTIFLTDIADYAAVNEVYGKYFEIDPPARSAIEVVALPGGALVEIEALAALD